MTPIRRLLVANRSEIAIRIFRAATELGIGTIAVYAEEDKLSLHRFKADEAYRIGAGLGPIAAYLAIDEVIRVAKEAKADAIHPGYGFLSESPEFAEACRAAGIIFIGPTPQTMRRLGDKVAARDLALSAGLPVMPATPPLPEDPAETQRLAETVGYPLMLKASWGGGGRGMRVIRTPDELFRSVTAARREAKAAFGKDDVYLEKLVERARHVEVQILADMHRNVVHLFERDCSVQRRNQKVVERAPAPYLDETARRALCDAALSLARAADYVGAGTVEFLMDADSGAFHFIEVNPRIQVEHTVTEEVTGVDVVKAQIRIAEGARIGTPASGVPAQKDIRLNGHALQCRVTTENPEDNFVPDYGRITAYRGAFGFGIRIDGGTAYSGAIVTRSYDPLLEKVTAWAPSAEEAIARMDRALREYRIRGVATNLAFLDNVIGHPRFRSGDITTRFIDETPELFDFPKRRDRATRLLAYIADVTVNGHPETRGRPRPPADARTPVPPVFQADPLPGAKQILDDYGPEGVAAFMRSQRRTLITDTTMRDAHQSLIATRMRTYDMRAAARAYAAGLPQLFSIECWGGATFDVAMRFLAEDPWERLAAIREHAPNILLQMLLRGANGVGYANYPENVIRFFVRQSAEAGVDLFRIFDALNLVDKMRPAIDAVAETGRIAEAAICYTGDMLDPARAKYDLSYYTKLARELESAGAHVLAIKDMAGLLKPAAARVLVRALKQETGLPLHLHTHDTSGISAATILAAIEAGVDAVDAAMDAFSGLTSQPCLGSIVEALRGTERDTGLDPQAIRQLSFYWEAVRTQYAAFESDLKAPASEVWLHEMPGGQFTNLREQARGLGLESRWHDVAAAYREVNDMFGDIVKVTPTSKVVGDLAVLMVSSNLSRAAVEDPAVEVPFPESVVQLMRGDLGEPPGGFPEPLRSKVLKGQESTGNAPPPLADLEAARAEAETAARRPIGDHDLASWLMYPKVFAKFARTERRFGPVSTLPTPVAFYGLEAGAEIAVEIERGKTLVIRCLGIGEADDEGQVKVFFELNGQPRIIRVADRSVQPARPARRKADSADPNHVAAPMPGVVSTLAVAPGQRVAQGDVLLTIEAMKMETVIHAERAASVTEILVGAGAQVDAKDLLVVLS